MILETYWEMIYIFGSDIGNILETIYSIGARIENILEIIYVVKVLLSDVLKHKCIVLFKGERKCFKHIITNSDTH